MNTPPWWYAAPGDRASAVLSQLLTPFSWLYDAARRKPHDHGAALSVPVICIGNVVAGGGGKTPVALAMGEWAKCYGIQAHFLSRGYGGSAEGPIPVDPVWDGAETVGDEPLLLAGTLPVIVAKNRLKGARTAIEKGAEWIVMDDGLQNPSIRKTRSILVIKGERPFGNGRLIPAGPLREPVAEALKRVDAIVHLDPPLHLSSIPELVRCRVPIYRAHTKLELPPIHSPRVVAFAGIARPELFKEALEREGLQVVGFHAFGDHRAYKTLELQRLADEAAAHHASLLTTEKDYVRLPKEKRDCAGVVRQRLEWEEADALDKMLGDLPAARSQMARLLQVKR